MAANKKNGLGKGLEALFGDVEIDFGDEDIVKEDKTDRLPKKITEKNAKSEKEDEAGSVVYININDIKPNENQPRKHFDEEKIAELSDSILTHGVIQPLIVRKVEGGYELVAGERRWRAARKAQLKKVPCLVRELTDEQNSLLAIIENMQREDLNPMEEADAISKMIDKYRLTQEQVAKSLSKSRPYITNALRLKKLPLEVQQLVSDGKLSAGHARALVAVEDESKAVFLADKAVKEGLSVREMERIASTANGKKALHKHSQRIIPEIASIEAELKELLGTKVKIKPNGKKGKLEIEYYSQEELERLIDFMKK